MYLLLALLLTISPCGVDDEPSKTEAAELHDRIQRHLDAARKACSTDARHGSLILTVELYPDAFEIEGLERLAKALASSSKIDEAIEKARTDRKSLLAMRGLPGFQLSLSQAKRGKEDLPSVYLFGGRLSQVLTLVVGGKEIRWLPWGTPRGLTPARIRVAQFETIRNRKRVPYIRPLEPDPHRLILTRKTGVVRGVLRKKISVGKLARSEFFIAGFHHYTGTFDDQQILDLNSPGHTFARDLDAKITRSLPPAPPPLPDDLREWLEKVTEKRRRTSQ